MNVIQFKHQNCILVQPISRSTRGRGQVIEAEARWSRPRPRPNNPRPRL